LCCRRRKPRKLQSSSQLGGWPAQLEGATFNRAPFAIERGHNAADSSTSPKQKRRWAGPPDSSPQPLSFLATLAALGYSRESNPSYILGCHHAYIPHVLVG
jgi:hypothetical protein